MKALLQTGSSGRAPVPPEKRFLTGRYEKIILLILLLPFIATGQSVYFVATDGNDSNAGGKEEPFLTIQHGINQLSAGDTLYIRGGTYFITGSISRANVHATESNPVVVSRYQNEEVIIDASGRTTTGGMLFVENLRHWKFFGIIFQNSPMLVEDVLAESVVIFNSEYVTVEQCVVRDIGGRGFRAVRSAYIYFINCDAYNIFNPLQYLGYAPGTAGNGFSSVGPTSISDEYWFWGLVVIDGCRAWNCGNNGVSAIGNFRIQVNNFWAFNINNRSISAGFNSQETPEDTYVVTNSVIACSNRRGFYNNNGGFTHSPGIKWYNNIVIHNQGLEADGETVLDTNAAFALHFGTNRDRSTIIRNNVAYHSNNDFWTNANPTTLVQDHNSWNIPLTLTDADFVGPLDIESLETALKAPRKADGSLPDLPNLRPSETSQLRGAGIDVGLPFTGTAPDLGPFEYTTSGTVTFDRQDGSGGSSSVNVTFGLPMPSATAPTRTGFTFHGYFDQVNGNGTRYYNSDMSSARNWDKTQNANLFAHWESLPASISTSSDDWDFGWVLVGETEERSITVRNIGGGTLSGHAQISPPFSVESGGVYELGADASQVIIVRYAPQSAGAHSRNMTFTGGGGAARSVTGGAIVAEEHGKVGKLDMDGEGEIVLRWPSLSGKTYAVYVSTNLREGFTLHTGHIPATPPENTFSDTILGVKQKFWRAVVEE